MQLPHNDVDQLTNYVSRAHAFIRNNDDITESNALALNHQLQQKLRVAKERLEQLLSRARLKYKENVQLLERIATRPSNPAERRLRCFYFCGAPFFKTIDGFSHPPNADYRHRKHVRKEHFPIDQQYQACRWSVNDKIRLIQGVKEQAIQTLIQAKCGHDDNALKKRKLVDIMDMLETVPEPFQFTIDWFTVSTKDLGTRHTPNECDALWTAFLHPQLNRKPWTRSENERLQAVALEFNAQNWPEIANQIPRRSAYQCVVQYQLLAVQQNVAKNVPWTPDEDKRLLETIEQCRIGNLVQWAMVSERITNRSRVQLYQR